MYGKDPLKNCLGVVDIENHFSEDNLKSIRFKEGASAVNELRNLLGYKHVKDKSKTDKDDFLSNWKHVVQTRPFTMSRMNELCDMAKHIRINDDMNARQILLYVPSY